MEKFGPYQLQERLGEGGLGELYRARDSRLGRVVALRLVPAAVTADSARRDALLSDAAAATGLSHPHVAALFDFGEDEGRVYLAHEYVPGQPMRALLAGRPLDPAIAIEFAVQLADALDAGHREGLLHADLRPSTVFVTPTGQTKITEFGLSGWTGGGAGRRALARTLSEGQEVAVAHGDEVAGYLSPEQVLGDRIDHRADIFSLGVLLYQMLTGRMPFAGGSAGKTALKVLQCTPTPVSRLNPALPAGLDPIVSRALAKSLDARYPTAAAMAADLRRLAADLDIPVTAETYSWKGPASTGSGARLGRRLFVAVAVLAMVAALAGAAWYSRDTLRHWLMPGPAVPKPVLVVLPFQVAGADGEKPYYGAAFSEDLAARMGEVPGLTVVGRASIRQTPVPTLESLGAGLGAAVALQGTARPGPYSLRVSVQLVEIATGRTFWTQQYAREPRQAFGVQAEIARHVAEQLRLQLPTGGRWSGAQLRQVDPSAYDLYLRGRDAAARSDLTGAATFFRQALQRASRLTEARLALAGALALSASEAATASDPALLVEARQALEAVLAADPEMPEAHVVAELIASTTAAAASSVARALSLDPSSGEAWHRAGDLLLELDPTRALACYRHSLVLEPALDVNHRDSAKALEILGQQAEADSVAAAGRRLRPDRPWWNALAARFEMVRGNPEGAAALLATDPTLDRVPLTWLMGRVVALRQASRTEAARAEALRLTTQYSGFCEGQAVLAGLEMDLGARPRASDLTSAIYRLAATAEAPPSASGCAAMAAAATGDGAEMASYLARVAGSDLALRSWTGRAVFSINQAFRRRWYPWSKIPDTGAAKDAALALDRGLARVRDDVVRRLPAVPPAASR